MGKLKLSSKYRKRRQARMVSIIIALAFICFAAVICFIALLFWGRSQETLPAVANMDMDVETLTEEEVFSSGDSTEESSSETEDTENKEATEEITEEISQETETEAQTVYLEATTEETTTEAADPVYIDIVAVGDNLIHEEIDVTVQLEDGSYYFDDIFDGAVKEVIQSADLAILNQEVPCAGNEYGVSGYPTFNAPTEILDTAARLGFDVLTLATNHALDKGQAGVENTLNYLHTNYPDILTTGTASTYEEYMTIPVIEVKGVKIAVLNYTYGTNGYTLYNDYCVNLLSDTEKIQSDIERAKECADFVIVCPHWGEEYVLTPNTEQRELAQFFADCGADLIIGTHPHVVEPMEWVTSADGREVLVYYSLGNFVSAQVAVPRSLGGMAKITLEYYAGEVSIVYNTLDFTVTYFTEENWTFDNFKVYMLRDFTDDLLSTYGIYRWVPDFTMQDFMDVVYTMNPEWE